MFPSSLSSTTTTKLVWLFGAVCCSTILFSSVDAKAILGIDMGSLYMKVALVQRGAPLEIVTNLHSKRKTEQMILFDQGSRFYGADANSLLARKPTKTPAGMSVMLGRDDAHPAVKVRLFFVISTIVSVFVRPILIGFSSTRKSRPQMVLNIN